MTNVIRVLFTILFMLTGFSLAPAADQDIKGSKDHPLLSRMPNFFIAEYKDILGNIKKEVAKIVIEMLN